MAPTAVWMTDEGLGGIVVHLANDHPQPLTARLRVALYRECEQQLLETHETIELEPHETNERDMEQLIGYFTDVGWAYRFGPPAQDVVVASLEQPGDAGVELLSQAVHFPAGRPTAAESGRSLRLHAAAQQGADEVVRLSIRTHRLAYGVRVHVAGFTADDDAFSIEPGGERTVLLHPREAGTAYPGGTLSALNLQGRIQIGAGTGSA
jgi:beta-mannosidase